MDQHPSSKWWRCFFIFNVFHMAIWVDAQPNSKMNMHILDDLIAPVRYDRRVRPIPTVEVNNSFSSSFLESPVTVQVHVIIHDIEIDDTNMECRLQLTFDQSWTDHRLNYAEIAEAPAYLMAMFDDESKLWNPGLNFVNLIVPKHTLSSPIYRIYPNGDVSCITRVFLRLSCPMRFHYFPFDSQLCYMTISSDAYTTDQLVLKWKSVAIQVNKVLRIKNYLLQAFGISSCVTETDVGEFSCVKAAFLFKRLNEFHLVRILFPCCMVVAISWLTFWLNSKQQIAVRLTMALMTLLVTSIQVSTYNSTVLSAGYIKFVDVWTGTCMALSFSALIQSVVIHNLQQRAGRSKKSDRVKCEPEQFPLKSVDSVEMNYQTMYSRIPARNVSRCSKIMIMVCSPDGVDFVSKIIYPIIFMSMLLSYWYAISHSSNSMEDEFSRSVDRRHSYVVDEKFEY